MSSIPIVNFWKFWHFGPIFWNFDLIKVLNRSLFPFIQYQLFLWFLKNSQEHMRILHQKKHTKKVIIKRIAIFKSLKNSHFFRKSCSVNSGANSFLAQNKQKKRHRPSWFKNDQNKQTNDFSQFLSKFFYNHFSVQKSQTSWRPPIINQNLQSWSNLIDVLVSILPRSPTKLLTKSHLQHVS